MDPQTDMKILAEAYGSPNAFKDDGGWSDTTTLPVFNTVSLIRLHLSVPSRN